MQSWDLLVTTDGDWAVAGMRALLPDGFTFYKHLHVLYTRPNPAIVALYPGVAFSTYVTTPNPLLDPAPGPILGGFPQGEPFSLGDSSSPMPGVLSVTWGDLAGTNPGTYQIARLTFPQAVSPNVINIADVGPQGPFSFTSQVVPDSVVEIPDIPEPATFSVIVWGLGIAARRRVC